MNPTTTSIAAPAGDGQGASWPSTTGPTFFPSTTIGPAATSPGLVPPAGVSPRAPTAAPAGGEDTQDTDTLTLSARELQAIASACHVLLERIERALHGQERRRGLRDRLAQQGGQYAGAEAAGLFPPLGSDLRRQRERLGLSQGDLATATGYARSSIAVMEGETRACLTTRRVVAVVLSEMEREAR